MSKKLKTIIATGALFILMSQSVFAELILFVGDGCGHCEMVEEYLQENEIYSKIQIKKYEIFKNSENREIYNEKGNEVGFPTERGSVPLLVHNGEYTVGSLGIIEYIETLVPVEKEVETEPVPGFGLASTLDTAVKEEKELIKAEAQPMPENNKISDGVKSIWEKIGEILGNFWDALKK